MLFIATVFLYPLALIGIGVWRGRNVRSHADFMVAGRSLSAKALVGTLVCTWVGSGTLFGGAGLAYRSGLSALWFSAGAWLGLVGVYHMAPRVRRLAQYTVPDILEARYNAPARVLGTVAIILAYVTIAAYQFRGGGWILNIATDGAISANTGMYITAATIVIFTAAAGMVSVVSVDIVNGIVIALGVVLALPYIVFSGGGPAAVYGALPEEMLTVSGGHNVLWVLGVAMPTFLLLFGESGMYQKFFSAKDGETARRAVLGMLGGIIVIEICIALLAMAGRSIYPDLATTTSLTGGAASETVIIYLARHGLPAAAGALLLAAAIAIVVSSGSTMLLVPSTNISRDIYQRFVNPDASDRLKLVLQRVSIVALGGLGLVMLTQFQSVLAMALYAYSVVGATLTPVLIAAFTWPRATAQGAVACIGGGLATIVGLVVGSRLGMDFSTTVGGTTFDFAGSDYIVIPAVLVSVSLLIIVSLLTPRPDPKTILNFMDS
ncbi:MAG: SSS family solute:Na+ symporter [Rhodothermales bacterium]|jgi:SSS family solute:Na+ symporter